MLQDWNESEDDLPDSESEDEETYYRSSRHIRDDLEGIINNDPEEDSEEAVRVQRDESDPPIIFDQPPPVDNEPVQDDSSDPPIISDSNSSSSRRPNQTRPVIWRKRNLLTTDEELIFRGNTELPNELVACNTALEVFNYFFVVVLLMVSM